MKSELSGPAGLSGVAEPETPIASDSFAIPERTRYAIRARLGEGGMGRVDLAFDRRLGREVAVKVASVAGGRLAQEAWITAQLEHPAIMPVFDAGTGSDGAPYYTMRVVRGRSLEHELSERVTLDQRLLVIRSLLTASEGVAYAHHHGIVHRDLKPQNILVGEFGETLVADWGVARVLSAGASQDRLQTMPTPSMSVVTAADAIVGTPAYMSPEQSLGAEPNPRADVWSLGAILYRILAGVPPYHGPSGAYIVEQVRTRSPAGLPRSVPAELRAIVRRAMARDPAQRYADAAGFAEDLARWLDGRRVAALEYSPFQLAWRVVRAWRVPLSITAVALVLLALAGWVAVRRVLAENARATAAEQATRRALGFAQTRRAEEAASRGRWLEAAQLAASALSEMGDAATEDVWRARGLAMAATRPHPVLLEQSASPSCTMAAFDFASGVTICTEATGLSAWQGGLRKWQSPTLRSHHVRFVRVEGGRVWVADQARLLHCLALASGVPVAAAVPLDGVDGLAVGGGRAVAHFGDVVQVVSMGDASPPRPVCAAGRMVRMVLVAPDGELLAGCDDGELHSSQDGRSWRFRAAIEATSMGTTSAMSGDGLKLALMNPRGRLTILDWPLATRIAQHETPVRGPLRLSMSDDGATLAVALLHGGPVLLGCESGKLIEQLPPSGAFVNWDGHDLLVAGEGGARRYRVPRPATPHVIGGDGAGLQGGVASLAVDSDGRIFVGRGAGELDVYLPDGTLEHHTRVGVQTVKSIAIGFDARTVYVAHVGAPTAVFRLDRGFEKESSVIGQVPHRRVGVLASRVVVVAGWKSSPALYSEEGQPIVRESATGAPAIDLSVTTDGRSAVLLQEDGGLLRTDGSAFEPILSVEGARLLSAGMDEVVVASATEVQVLGLDGGVRARFGVDVSPLDAALSPDHRFIVVGEPQGARVYDRDGGCVAILGGHTERVGQLVSTAEALYTGSWDGTVRRWGWAGLGQPTASTFRDAEP